MPLFDFWNATLDLYALFGFSALLGIIMYYWTKALDQVKAAKLSKIYRESQVQDIE